MDNLPELPKEVQKEKVEDVLQTEEPIKGSCHHHHLDLNPFNMIFDPPFLIREVEGTIQLEEPEHHHRKPTFVEVMKGKFTSAPPEEKPESMLLFKLRKLYVYLFSF